MITAVLDIIEKNYAYDSMFRYLRTGFTQLTRDEIDILDNYCLAVGIKGRKQWNNEWIRKFRTGREDTDLGLLNRLRREVITPIDVLHKDIKEADGNVAAITRALYEFIAGLDCERKLSSIDVDSEEYGQIYKKIIELLDKIVELLGSEKVTLKEYNHIIASGLDEIKIGLIPPANDCVVIGDIERTRLDNIKVMFFAGVNDGYVPKKATTEAFFQKQTGTGLRIWTYHYQCQSGKKRLFRDFIYTLL